MKTTPIFNPGGNDNKSHRKMWYGNTTNLMQLNDVRFNWALQIYNVMLEQFWIPQKIDITADVNDYTELTVEERRAYDGILSYLTFLDSIQTCNLPHVKSVITAPEVSLCISTQLFFENIHNAAYQYMIETIIPDNRRNQIYDLWREDKILYERCTHIAAAYQNYIDDPTDENYFYSLVANYILEGLYFYAGFTYFYNLASRMLMSGSSDVIVLINRKYCGFLQ